MESLSREQAHAVADASVAVDDVTVRFSRELVEQMADWGPPVQCKLVRLENGEYDLLARTLSDEMIEQRSWPRREMVDPPHGLDQFAKSLP